MIEIIDKTKCTGCGACYATCPFDAISMELDYDGFVYPVINSMKCKECHLCERRCHMLNLPERISIKGFPKFYAGQLKDIKELSEVSSGGAAWALTRAILKEGGIVYGAKQIGVDKIVHERAKNIEEALLLRRSKYLQSDTKDVFRAILNDLTLGVKVLFVGTGCQVSALKSFLGRDFDNLITCDVVCHGVPSIKVWKKYREEKELLVNKKIRELIFRDKSLGWSNNQYRITYDDNTEETEKSVNHIFHSGYLSGLFYRPSCGDCKFSQIPRVSDITLADYWLYKGSFHSESNNVGVSLICVNTLNGMAILNKSKEFINLESTTKELAFESCKHLHEHPFENPNRAAFLKLFHEKGYYAAANKYVKEGKSIMIYSKIKSKIKKIFIKYGK